jgi:CheY-like chemotaxis protein
MEAIGLLAGGIAHDFNNILTTILGYGGLALERIDKLDPLFDEISEIQRAGERAAELTRKLLAFSRKQILEPRVIDLNATVSGMERMLRRTIGEDVQLVFRPAANLGRVRADPGQVEQVLLNLAVNARDPMPKGGSLTIETNNVRLDEEYARTHVDPASTGDVVMFAVSDSGSGMDEQTRSRIFEPFFTTKELGKGTGLGLSTVYGIVRQSGGHIDCYSEPGTGTTFKVYLPRVGEEATVIPAPVVSGDLQGSETLLVVEDEETLATLARRALERRGYRVLVARNGSAALEIALAHPEIELLLTDVVMPGMSGPELAEVLRAQSPGLKVLFMSGYTDNAIIQHGLLDSGVAFLQKPFTPDGLARKVREILGPV